MNACASRAALLDALSRLEVSSGREALVQLEGADDTLMLTATDLDVVVRVVISCARGASDRAVVPMPLLKEFLRRAVGEEAHFSNGGVVRVGRARITLPVVEHAMVVPPLDFDAAEARLDAEVFRRGVGLTSFAAGSAATTLSGLEWRQGDEGYSFLATDGRTFASLAAGAVPSEGAVILPARSMEAAVRALDGLSEVSVAVGGSYVRLRGDGVVVGVRRMNGDYPDCRAFFGLKGDKELVVDRARLRQACRTAGVVFQTGDVPRLRLRVEDGALTVMARSDVLGSDATEEVEADYQGEAVRVALNLRYLLAALDHLQAERVRLVFKDALFPVRLEPAGGGSTDARYTALIATLRDD